MRHLIRFAVIAGLATTLGLVSVGPLLLAQSTLAPGAYDAVTDRGPRPKPTLVRLGNAGFSFNDPVFGSRLWRVTDRLTRPGSPDRSFRTPSATHQNEWSANSSYFYVVSNGGTMIPFAFDSSSGAARRIDATGSGDGGFVLRFYIEPQFSYVSDNVIFGSYSGPGTNLHSIDQYDFNTRSYSQLLDLETLVPSLKDTFVGGLGSSGGPVERIMAFFGGTSQDRHYYVVVFDRANVRNRHLLDTHASTIDGRPAAATLNFNLHHAFIDRSGRFVLLYPTTPDRNAPRNAAPFYVWDLTTNAVDAVPLDSAHSGGHDAFGYGVAVNKDCCVSTQQWDAAQWQLRSLGAPSVSRDLVAPLLTPTETFMSDHPTWNNARPDRLVPFISATYRYGTNNVEWRPWDDEIIAVQTDVAPDASAQVWRFAHHRSDIRDDNDPTDLSFWYQPRPNISPDGRWVLFTSNWEKTLGTDPQGATGEKARQDAFLLQLKPSPDESTVTLPLEITAATLPDAKRNTAYVAAVTTVHGRGVVTWRITRGALPAGLSLDARSGLITGSPAASGGTLFTVTVTDASTTVSRSYSLVVRR